jgi:hypothetical protein
MIKRSKSVMSTYSKISACSEPINYFKYFHIDADNSSGKHSPNSLINKEYENNEKLFIINNKNNYNNNNNNNNINKILNISLNIEDLSKKSKIITAKCISSLWNRV